MDRDALREAELDAALRDLAQRWRSEVKYVASRFSQLLNSRGALGAVGHLLTRQLSGRLSSRGGVARQRISWNFSNWRSARLRKVIGYSRAHSLESRSTPAQQTVSP
jgi:hypothetical protein